MPDELKSFLRYKKKYFCTRLLSWWGINKRSYPWRTRKNSPYRILIAEILLKRTTATAANNAFLDFIKQYKDIESLYKADSAHLEKLLSCVGLHKQRSKGLKEIAIYICNEEKGVIPKNLESLLKVPHIGQYTSRAILSFGYNIPTGVVDSNVIRVANRIFYGLIPQKASLSLLQDIVDYLLPQDKHKEFNWALLDFAALVCRYSYPLHEICPLYTICRYPEK